MRKSLSKVDPSQMQEHFRNWRSNLNSISEGKLEEIRTDLKCFLHRNLRFHFRNKYTNFKGEKKRRRKRRRCDDAQWIRTIGEKGIMLRSDPQSMVGLTIIPLFLFIASCFFVKRDELKRLLSLNERRRRQP